MPVADYLAVMDILKPLWKKVGPEVARKVKIANHRAPVRCRQD